MVAAGSYLKALRESQKLTQLDIATAIGSTVNTVWRVEDGRQEPKAANLVNWLAFLHGRAEDLAALINDASATVEDGQKKAHAWFIEYSAQATDQERRAAAEKLRKLADDVEAGRSALPRI